MAQTRQHFGQFLLKPMCMLTKKYAVSHKITKFSKNIVCSFNCLAPIQEIHYVTTLAGGSAQWMWIMTHGLAEAVRAIIWGPGGTVLVKQGTATKCHLFILKPTSMDFPTRSTNQLSLLKQISIHLNFECYNSTFIIQ